MNNEERAKEFIDGSYSEVNMENFSYDDALKLNNEYLALITYTLTLAKELDAKDKEIKELEDSIKLCSGSCRIKVESDEEL